MMIEFDYTINVVDATIDCFLIFVLLYLSFNLRKLQKIEHKAAESEALSTAEQTKRYLRSLPGSPGGF